MVKFYGNIFIIIFLFLLCGCGESQEQKDIKIIYSQCIEDGKKAYECKLMIQAAYGNHVEVDFVPMPMPMPMQIYQSK